MKVINNYHSAADMLTDNRIGILPTDTIYGISCLAKSKQNVEKIYEIKKRGFTKPFILLISTVKDLESFGINLSDYERKIVGKYWPGRVSIIFRVESESLSYLHRGTQTLAFRIPDKNSLVSLLSETGPIISTSANISNSEPIKNLDEAKKVFNDKVDFFLDEGEQNNEPSKVISLTTSQETIIRS